VTGAEAWTSRPPVLSTQKTPKAKPSEEEKSHKHGNINGMEEEKSQYPFGASSSAAGTAQLKQTNRFMFTDIKEKD